MYIFWKKMILISFYLIWFDFWTKNNQPQAKIDKLGRVVDSERLNISRWRMS